jgi:hypothetical protein
MEWNKTLPKQFFSHFLWYNHQNVQENADKNSMATQKLPVCAENVNLLSENVSIPPCLAQIGAEARPHR